jgi:hypothetical protein
MSDYVNIALRYNTVDADPAFALSFVPAHMANLRALLHVDSGMADDIACGISAGIWLIACVALALLPFRFRVPAPLCWALSILAYLLLFPHVTSTEELQLYLPLLLLFRARGAPDRSVWVMLILTTLAPFLSPAVGPAAGNRAALFVVKLALAAMSIQALRRWGTDNGKYGAPFTDAASGASAGSTP